MGRWIDGWTPHTRIILVTPMLTLLVTILLVYNRLRLILLVSSFIECSVTDIRQAGGSVVGRHIVSDLSKAKSFILDQIRKYVN